MLKPNTTHCLLTTLSILLPGIAMADVDTSEWLCEFCPFEDGYRGSYDAGATYVSEDSARFGNGTGYDEKGAYAELDGNGSYANGAYRLDWSVEDLGLSSRVLELDGGLQGSFGFTIGYREMPYRQFNTARTIFAASRPDALALPGGWVAAGTTGGFTQLASPLQPQNAESDRQVFDLGGNWTPGSHFRVFADFQRQNRDGIKISGGSSFTNASLLPQWFDYETDRIDAGISYATSRANLGVAYYGSFFTNNQQSYSWETPFTSSPGAEVLRKSAAPSNDFHQIALSGAFRATAWDTVTTFSAASGRGEQNEAFLPYSINPNISAGALPSDSLGAKVDTSNYAIAISTRPFPKGRIRFTYRVDERDNKTLRSDWNRVIVDAFSSGEIEQNTPYSFDRSHLTLSGELVTWKDIRISGGYGHKVLERDYQEVAKQTIDAGWGQLRWRPLSWLDFRVKGGTEERDIDRYDESVGASFGQNPLLRKYNLAYRFRSYGELFVGIAPGESRWSIGSTVLVADDRYNKSLLGMTDSEEIRATIDVSFAISKNASTYFIIGHENIDALQLGSEQFNNWDWLADHEDTFDHVGIGARWRDANDKFDISADYNRGAGKTSIRMESVSGGDSLLPDLKSTLDSVRIKASYRWTERLQGIVDIRVEQFELNDWALVAPDAIPTVLTLGAEPYDYDLWAIGLGVRYSFGSRDIALAN